MAPLALVFITCTAEALSSETSSLKTSTPVSWSTWEAWPRRSWSFLWNSPSFESYQKQRAAQLWKEEIIWWRIPLYQPRHSLVLENNGSLYFASQVPQLTRSLQKRVGDKSTLKGRAGRRKEAIVSNWLAGLMKNSKIVSSDSWNRLVRWFVRHQKFCIIDTGCFFRSARTSWNTFVRSLVCPSRAKNLNHI